MRHTEGPIGEEEGKRGQAKIAVAVKNEWQGFSDKSRAKRPWDQLFIWQLISSTCVLLTFTFFSYSKKKENNRKGRQEIGHSGHPSFPTLIHFFGQCWSPEEDPGGCLECWWSPRQSSASPTLFLLKSQRLLVSTFTSIQHSSQNSSAVYIHSKVWAGLSSYNNMAMDISQSWSMTNGRENLQAWFCSCPSRTRALLNSLVVCSCSHTDLMSLFNCGDMCQENLGAWGVSEEGQVVMWRGGEEGICRYLGICEAISNNSINLVTSHFWSSGWPQCDVKLGRPLWNQHLPWKRNNRHTGFDVWLGDIL